MKSRQEGQTLVVFALVMAFLLVGMLAMVGDYAVVVSHYNGIDEAALLAAQSGASKIDLTVYTATHEVRLDPVQAKLECQRVALANAPFVRATDVNCLVGANFVEAQISDGGSLPVRVLGNNFSISANHRSYAAYGISQPCGPC